MSNSPLKQIGGSLQLVVYTIPYVLAASCCAGISPFWLFAVSLLLIGASLLRLSEPVPVMGAFLLLPFLFVAAAYGALACVASLVLFIVIAMALGLAPHQVRNKIVSPHIVGALTLALAFSATALLTTHYFGIGAQGNTVSEILVAYRSLGFHANWRGVLYGTVTLVIMITYPRKFKNLKNYIPSALPALMIPLMLNLFLIPDFSLNTITEVRELLLVKPALEVAESAPQLISALPAVLTAAVSAVLIMLVLEYGNEKKKDITEQTEAQELVGCVPAIQRAQLIEGAQPFAVRFLSIPVCFILLMAVLVFYPLFGRIPLASFAVVLIVSAWQCVRWDLLAGAFKKGVVTAFGALLIFGSVFVGDICVTVYFAFGISIIYCLVEMKKSGKPKGGEQNG